MPLNKEQVAKQVMQALPHDANLKVDKITYFPKKIVLSGQSHISRKNQLVKLTKKLSKQYNWDITFKFIYIDGNINDYIIEKVIESFPHRYDIEKIHIDLKTKKIHIHCFISSELPKITIDKLKKIENEFKLDILISNIETGSITKLKELLIQSSAGSTSNKESDNQTINSEELSQNIYNLLPKWVNKPEVIVPKNFHPDNSDSNVILEVTNDFTDIERISFLEMLLENQLGFKVAINQKYDVKPQIAIAENIVKEYIDTFTSELIKDSNILTIKYSSFPLDQKSEKELREKVVQQSKLSIEFSNSYDPLPMSLELKKSINRLSPEIDYSYVTFDSEKNCFLVLIPEESIKEISVDQLTSSLESSYKVKINFSIIEENPVIYLTERILIDQIKTKQIKKVKFNSEKKKIQIFCGDPFEDISQDQWRKILYRLSKFSIEFLDTKKKKYHLSDFSYYNELDEPDLIDLLIKILPSELRVKDVYWYERSGYWLVKYNNLLLSNDQLNKIQKNISQTWNLNIFYQPARTADDLINTLLEELPEWIIKPKVTVQEKILVLAVENDYTDENRLEDFRNTFISKHKVLVNIQFKLSVSRIKHIVVDTLKEHIDIVRIKVYPEKNQVYLEGVIKRGGVEEDAIQESLDNIEEKTKYIVEAYIKPSSTKGETVHEILNKLNDTYQLTNTVPEDINIELESFQAPNIELEVKNRLDLRDWECLSIDTLGTRVIDDLISIQRLTHDEKEDEYLLGIHIADVNFFSPKNSPLDSYIREKGLSMYVGEYFPMIPEKITRFISLDEGEDRLAISMLVEISLEGEIIDYWIKKTVVRNRKQFSFEQANEKLMEHSGELVNDLQILVTLTYQLRHQRIERGSFNLDVDFVPDDQASQIISEIMILANRLMGFYMQNSSGQKIFRNQHIPSYAYVSLAQTLELYGYKLDLLNKNPLTELNQILSIASQKNEHQLVFKELRRYLANAYYSHNCYGYESLGTHFYTHWTSPMRRYIDIAVARLAINNDTHIDNLIGLCQYQSALERFSRIKGDNYTVQMQINRLELNKDKPLLGELYGYNRKQIVFLIKSLNAYTTIRVANNPAIMLLGPDQGIEFQGQRLAIGDEIFLQIVDITKEKREIFLILGLLEKLEIGQKFNVKAKLMFLD